MKKDLSDKVRKYMILTGMALAMLFCLTACGDSKYDKNENDTSVESNSLGDDSDPDENVPEDNTEDNTTKTFEKSFEVEDNGDGTLESSFSLTGDGVEEIEEGSD